jgi:hypothetical protein
MDRQPIGNSDIQVKNARLSGPIVRSKARDSNFPLPCPGLLQVHAMIARILYDSGMLAEIDKEGLEEYDDLHALAPDGSTNVSMAFQRALIRCAIPW